MDSLLSARLLTSLISAVVALFTRRFSIRLFLTTPLHFIAPARRSSPPRASGIAPAKLHRLHTPYNITAFDRARQNRKS